MYCQKHQTFNRFCRDCLRRKYEQQEEEPPSSVEDATGYSGLGTMAGEVIALETGTTKERTP